MVSMAVSGAGFLQCQHGRRLDAVEEHERAVLLVGERPLRVGRMRRHEVDQRQGVIGVGHRAGELPQRQAANPPVIELQELAVDLDALLFVECKGLPFDALQLPEPVEARLGPAGVLAVGPAGDLHLQQAHLDPHLEHLAAVAGADQPRGNHPRLEGPLAKNEVDVECVRTWPYLSGSAGG